MKREKFHFEAHRNKKKIYIMPRKEEYEDFCK